MISFISGAGDEHEFAFIRIEDKGWFYCSMCGHIFPAPYGAPVVSSTCPDETEPNIRSYLKA